jgi:protein TonB
MKISHRNLIILGIIIAIHLSFFSLSMIHFGKEETKKETVMQAELVSSPKPSPQPTPKAEEPATKTPPTPKPELAKTLTVAPVSPKQASKPVEKKDPIQKNKSEAESIEKSDRGVSKDSTQASETASSSNTQKSPIQIGADGGAVALNQLVMVYRPDTEVFYPRISKDIGEQGVVVVQMFIDESGSVTTVRVIDSSGFKRLDKAASDLATRIRFAPYRVNGQAIRVNAAIAIRFQLHQ